MTQNRRNKQAPVRKSTARAILTNIHALRERSYVGDVGAIDTLLDFETVVEMAKLTTKQKEALRLVYDAGMTQREAAQVMGTTREAVAKLIERAVESIYDAKPENFEEDYEMGKPQKVFNIRATDEVEIDMEEMKRVPCVIFGKVPKGARVEIIPNSTTARWTNLQLLEREFDGTVTLINMSNPDNFTDCIDGHSDGSYTVTRMTDIGETIDVVTLHSIDFNYEVQDVPYLIRKGDIIARAEIYVD